jgi:hypothetical protein
MSELAVGRQQLLHLKRDTWRSSSDRTNPVATPDALKGPNMARGVVNSLLKILQTQ